ncbi:dehydrogenase [Paenibacillus sp. 1P07SE]|uniref:dehydrogenase n=1 Tax=Paenibacillus sp. 1P07SE TaxID=3132209 RepID=UPI0039A73324
MKTPPRAQTSPDLPTARKIKRACSKELYRTVKRLDRWIPPALVEQAEQIYIRKVMLNLIWIHENRSNRKLLCDWWDEQLSEEIAALWGIDREQLAAAFRHAFGG